MHPVGIHKPDSGRCQIGLFKATRCLVAGGLQIRSGLSLIAEAPAGITDIHRIQKFDPFVCICRVIATVSTGITDAKLGDKDRCSCRYRGPHLLTLVLIMRSGVEMECVHNVLKAVILERLLRHILNILRPVIGSADDQCLASAVTDNACDIFTIGIKIIAAGIPLYAGRLVADLKDHVIVILVQRYILLEELLCHSLCGMWILLMDMPVHDHIHAKLLRRLYALNDLGVDQALTAVGITIVLSDIACHTQQVHAPLITERLHRSLIDIFREPLHTMGTGSTHLERLAVLIHDHRRITVAVHLCEMKSSVLSNRCLRIRRILQLTG